MLNTRVSEEFGHPTDFSLLIIFFLSLARNSQRGFIKELYIIQSWQGKLLADFILKSYATFLSSSSGIKDAIEIREITANTARIAAIPSNPNQSPIKKHP